MISSSGPKIHDSVKPALHGGCVNTQVSNLAHFTVKIVLTWCLVFFIVFSLPGCGGCRPDPSAKKSDKKKEKKDKKKEKPKPPFQLIDRLHVLPGDDASIKTAVKPGHWVSVVQRMKANSADFNGELFSTSTINNGRPIDLQRTPYHLTMLRPASLPKGQTKQFELIYYVPRQLTRDRKTPLLQMKLRGKGGGREVIGNGYGDPASTMPPHQYHFLVLARYADAYGYLKRLDSMIPPWDDMNLEGRSMYYRVVLPKLGKRTTFPLPSNSLLWTSIAYILWDDVDPRRLTPDQQVAMTDWLHWGGQLIVSGPGSLDALRGSFLGDYLPADPGKTSRLDQDAFHQINELFTLPLDKDIRSPLTVVQNKPPEGVELKIRPGAYFIPHTAALLAERRVGHGRIVVTSFSMTNRQVINWRNFDGFFNACLLRRPPRKYFLGEGGALSLNWNDKKLQTHRLDARLITGLRYFSRDMGNLSGMERLVLPAHYIAYGNPPGTGLRVERQVVEVEAIPPEREAAEEKAAVAAWHKAEPLFDTGFSTSRQSGVAGWNDFSGVSNAARRSLNDAAGISIPNARFVLTVLTAYLLMLVPVNYGLFRLVGRVEWAWIAAPLIAIAGAAAVIRLAQLDIGFARSRTEIALLELQGPYHRGHLTRYTALYTSLSTNYDAHFEDKGALAQPFSIDPNFRWRVGQRSSRVTYRRAGQVHLHGFKVASNSTDMLHSEQMVDLSGGIRLRGGEERGFKIVNGSSLSLRDVGVIRRIAVGAKSRIQVAWIGTLRPKREALVHFGAVKHDRALLPQWEKSSVTATTMPAGEINLHRLLDLARDPRRLAVGDVRLVGWTEKPMGGMEIRPQAAQAQYLTLVVAHLRHAPLPEPRADKNTLSAVQSADVSVQDTSEP